MGKQSFPGSHCCCLRLTHIPLQDVTWPADTRGQVATHGSTRATWRHSPPPTQEQPAGHDAIRVRVFLAGRERCWAKCSYPPRTLNAHGRAPFCLARGSGSSQWKSCRSRDETQPRRASDQRLDRGSPAPRLPSSQAPRSGTTPLPLRGPTAGSGSMDWLSDGLLVSSLRQG